MKEQLAHPVTLRITQDHISSLKAGRFFTQWVAQPADYTDNDKVNGLWRVGDEITFRHRLFIEPYSGIMARGYRPSLGGMASHGLCSIGFQSYSYSPLPEQVCIGRYSSISNNVLFLDSAHPLDRISTAHFTHKTGSYIVESCVRDLHVPRPRVGDFEPMMGKSYPTFGHDVWVGQGALLCSGISLGTGCAVAANSVVTKDVPPYAIVGRNPANIIGWRFKPDLIHRLISSQWWHYNFADFDVIHDRNVVETLDWLDQARENGTIQEYQPKPLILPDAWI